jgi:hypothetical protein
MARKGRRRKVGRPPKVEVEKAAPAEGGIFGKTLSEYYEVVKLPLAVLIIWSVISFLVLLALQPLQPIAGLIGLALLIIAGLYVGWAMVKNQAGGILQATAAGVGLGAISSAVSGVLNIIAAIIQPSAFGPVAELAGGGIVALTVVGAVIGVIAGAVVGGVLSLIGGLVAKYT